MLRLDIADYLWLELHKEYQHIFHLHTKSNGVTLHLADKDAYQEYFSKSLLFSPEGYKGPTDIPMDGAKAAKWLSRQIDRKNGKCAILVELPVLDRLYGSGANRKPLDELLKKLADTKNTLVILSPATMTAGDLSIFRAPDGVFAYRSDRGHSLCPELYAMLHGAAPVPMFHQLKTRLGRQVVEPDVITFEGIKILLEHIRFRRGAEWEDAEFLDYANFIHRWWYRDSVRKTCPDLFPNARSYRDIYEELTKPDGWQRLLDRLNGYKKRNGNKPVYIIDGPFDRQALESECRITRDDPVAAELARLTWPKELSGSFPGADAEALHHAQHKLTRPYSEEFCPGRREKLALFLKLYDNAKRCSDIDTMRRAMRAILFSANTIHKNYVGNVECEKFLKQHSANLQQSVKYYQIWKNIQQQQHATGQIADGVLTGLMGQLNALEAQLLTSDALLNTDPELLQTQSSTSTQQELEEIQKMLQESFLPDRQEEAVPEAQVYDREEGEALLQGLADLF